MKINSIRLHPFAGFSDKTFSFADGLNLVHGANEFGKSTLFSAISAVLFIESKPRKGSDDDKLIQRFMPRQGGSEIRLTIHFEADGGRHVLSKTWNGHTRLNKVTLTSAGSEYGDQEAEDRLKSLLRLNRASWENMLFIEQSSIHETVARLRTGLQSMAQIQSFMKDADPFDQSGFITKVKEQLAQHESRWDNVLKRPAGGRGIENPWSNGVGLILKTWYEKEQYRARHQEILQAETRIGALNQQITAVSSEKDALDAFIRTGEPLLKDANRSIQIMAEKQVVERDGNALKEIHKQWVSAESQLPGLRQNLLQLKADRQKLEEELEHARKRSMADDVLRRDQEVQSLVNNLTEQRSILDGMSDIPETSLKEADSAAEAIREARIMLEAQQLKATLNATDDTRVTAFISGNNQQEIDLLAGVSETLSSRGSITITHGPLSLRVVSGNINVDQLEQSILLHEQTICSICATYNVDDIDALRASRKELLKASEKVKVLDGNLRAQLGGRSLDQWNQEAAALRNIPAARSMNVVQDALNDLAPRIARLEHDISVMDQSLAQWLSEFVNQEKLLDRVTELRVSWKQLVEEAAALKPLPEGYKHPNEFIQALQAKQHRRGQLVDQVANLVEERATLMGRLEREDFSAEELSEKIQAAEMNYDHRLSQAQALRRILEVSESLNDEAYADPFDQVGARIQALVERLSGGRYGHVEFNANLPERIGNDVIRLEADLLSKGMKGSLALAVRLAYAEVYLTDMDGFLMLDDPFTELDPERRNHAAAVLQEMAKEKQMILFTCHPEHAQLFPDAVFAGGE
jgi:DNA repair protein SbcC/Rad50